MDNARPIGMEDYNVTRTDEIKHNALEKEIGGNHYKGNYQPVELIEKVRMYFCCGNVLKYVYRHKNKNGRQDLEKALHYCDLMEALGMNWYQGLVKTNYEMDMSYEEFHKFIKANRQLDANQVRVILAICDKDIEMLKSAIRDLLSDYS